MIAIDEATEALYQYILSGSAAERLILWRHGYRVIIIEEGIRKAFLAGDWRALAEWQRADESWQTREAQQKQLCKRQRIVLLDRKIHALRVRYEQIRLLQQDERRGTFASRCDAPECHKEYWHLAAVLADIVGGISRHIRAIAALEAEQ